MQDIVFISPILPDFHANGLAMRGAQNLRALSTDFRIHLLVIQIYGSRQEEPSLEIQSLCKSWKIIPFEYKKAQTRFSLFQRFFNPSVVLPAWQKFDPAIAREIYRHIESIKPAALWVFRFYMLPWIKEWLQKKGEAWLDLDESEAVSHRRLSRLYEERKMPGKAKVVRQQATAFGKLEKIYLKRFTRLVVSSSHEQENLRQNYNLKTEVWPNVINLPEAITTIGSPENEQPHFFFVGNMHYLPNRDALHFLCSEILPRFRSLSGLSPRVQIAGWGSWQYLHEFSDEKSLEWLGEIADLAEPYRKADVVLVPLRSGGGTRIKILEAFSWSKPVVSTLIGAEGLAVKHDQEILLAGDADSFANAMYALIQNTEKARQLGRAGRLLVEKYHSPAILRELAASWLRP